MAITAPTLIRGILLAIIIIIIIPTEEYHRRQRAASFKARPTWTKRRR